MKTFLARFLRNMAGIGIGVGVSMAGNYTGLIPLAYQALVPILVGPALNAAAKAGRTLLDDGVAKNLCQIL
jgi:hypothetical protein